MSYAEQLPTESEYAKNKFILRWWTSAHDQLLLDAIQELHWIWFWSITDRILAITPPAKIERWKQTDPICSRYAWYNVIMNFAAARAKERGYYSRIRKPGSRRCAACGTIFQEDTLPPSAVNHLGIDRIDICFQCVRQGFYNASGDRLGRQGIMTWIRDVVNELGTIPSQNQFDSLASISALSSAERAVFVRLAKRRPSAARVKSIFGTWLNALVQAGILQDGVRETARGTQALARDGHVCLSLGEKTIDDYLFKHGIPHSREPRYPGSDYRADFKVGMYLVEYFGLSGDSEYDQKAEVKRALAKEHGIELIELYPNDLLNEGRLARKLKPATGTSDA